eukprot:TRINITY_DN826_c0_g1_i1.p1 TRINITY_DN826_c0_g1~~TRINITY_DN826_c0_g1_i1.p1  ORF type:complete len:158 (-),score=33.01 TRINITY_DN826_c0_g1_i1:75-548(-)
MLLSTTSAKTDTTRSKPTTKTHTININQIESTKMSASPRVLLVGLPSNHHSVPAEVKPRIEKMLEQAGTEISKAGYEFEYFGAAPEDGSQPLIAKLKEKKFDGICIGFGVRSQPQLTVFFEDLVNAVMKNSVHSQLIFNTAPENTLEAIKRRLPVSN